MTKKILLLSGGIDSTAALFLFEPDIALTVDMKIDYNKQELRAIDSIIKLAKEFNINTEFVTENNFINLYKFEQSDANIPLRNLYLISYAVNYAILNEFNSVEIILVVQKDEMSIPDRSEKFFTQAEELLSYLSDIDIKLSLPFIDKDKTDIVADLIEKYGKLKAKRILFYTYSCYSGKNKECGLCKACVRKWVSLINNNIEDICIFEQEPYYSKTFNNYIFNSGNYSKKRKERFINAKRLYEINLKDKLYDIS